MIVVSDASVLINLDRIGQLALLREIYGRVAVPAAVWHEVWRGAPRLMESQSEWIELIPVANRELVAKLAENLDPGESEAIALAIEIRADFLLIDENLGRATALRLGVRITGLLGLLVVAKHRKLIPAVAPHVQALLEEGFWLSADLVARILQQVNESK